MPTLNAEEKHVQDATELLLGESVSHFWDPNGQSGYRFQATLGIDVYAWDVWMIYPTGIGWEKKIPPSPELWQHQLRDVDDKNRLNVSLFDEKLLELLTQFD